MREIVQHKIIGHIGKSWLFIFTIDNFALVISISISMNYIVLASFSTLGAECLMTSFHVWKTMMCYQRFTSHDKPRIFLFRWVGYLMYNFWRRKESALWDSCIYWNRVAALTLERNLKHVIGIYTVVKLPSVTLQSGCSFCCLSSISQRSLFPGGENSFTLWCSLKSETLNLAY